MTINMQPETSKGWTLWSIKAVFIGVVSVLSLGQLMYFRTSYFSLFNIARSMEKRNDTLIARDGIPAISEVEIDQRLKLMQDELTAIEVQIGSMKEALKVKDEQTEEQIDNIYKDARNNMDRLKAEMRAKCKHDVDQVIYSYRNRTEGQLAEQRRQLTAQFEERLVIQEQRSEEKLAEQKRQLTAQFEERLVIQEQRSEGQLAEQKRQFQTQLDQKVREFNQEKRAYETKQRQLQEYEKRLSEQQRQLQEYESRLSEQQRQLQEHETLLSEQRRKWQAYQRGITEPTRTMASMRFTENNDT